MKSKIVLVSFLFVSCALGGFNDALAAATKKVASTNYVDTKITKTSGAIEIKNDASKNVTLQNNPTSASGLDSNSKVVTTVGWADTNRTSKVKSVQNNTTSLVDMWIE